MAKANCIPVALAAAAGAVLLPLSALAADANLSPVACGSLDTASGGKLRVDSAMVVAATPLAIAERGPTPAARVSPMTPEFCRVLGHIDPVDPKAPAIKFQLNLPLAWNGRSVQYGGGGFNGVLTTGLGLPPSMPFDAASPLARGYATYGTDSGHQTAQGEAPQAFASNDEAFVNFAHASYKKVREAARTLMVAAYGKAPDRMYFMGSSEGGREGLTMAQRYPKDFDGIFARVPVINWTGLQHAGTRGGLATMGEAWLRPAQVKLVSDAVLAACDKADGIADGLVGDAAGCKARFKPAALLCPAGTGGDACLSAAQVKAVETLHSAYVSPVPLANGIREYPGWGVSGEGAPANGPTGGWAAWWLGSAAPAQPALPANGIAWIFGAGAMQHIFARDPKFDVTKYRAEDFAPRVREVSALMDSTNPDLSAFKANGGKLIMLEHMSDYAQSPYAGINYFASVQKRLGARKAAEFARLYTAPGVDHVGAGAPANVDMLAILAAWVEQGKAPGDLEVTEQALALPVAVKRALPLCQWPAWPHHKSGDANSAASFACAR